MNFRFLVVPAFALAACTTPVPDSNPERGPGFSSPEAYAAEQARREAELSGMGRGGNFDPEARAIAQDTLNVLNSRPDPMTGTINPGMGQPIDVTNDTTAVAAIDRSTISDEQDFGVVSERRDIQTDAARIARATEAYTVVQPTAVPTRPSDAGPNVVAFALQTTNRVGEPIYDRSGLFSESRYNRACSKFASPNQAQSEFLANGGPERDRAGMDPDGDGFACLWDPTPFRAARGG